jgi:hypothetical protein
VKFTGVRDLAAFLAGNAETQDAFVEHLFHYLVKQPIRAFGPQKLVDLRQQFADNRYNVRKLMVGIVVESALTPDRTNDRHKPAGEPRTNRPKPGVRPSQGVTRP